MVTLGPTPHWVLWEDMQITMNYHFQYPEFRNILIKRDKTKLHINTMRDYGDKNSIGQVDSGKSFL